MRRRIAILLGCITACGSGESPPAPPDVVPFVNPCDIDETIPGGTVELGLGPNFTPVVAGDDLTLELGTQGLWMFVMNVHVRDMDVGDGAQLGAVRFTAFDMKGSEVTQDFGCRPRAFTDLGDGSRALDGTYEMPFRIEISEQLDGQRVTIRLDLRDHLGRQAIDERSVVAHMP